MKLRKFNDFKKIYENNPGIMMEPGQPEELTYTSGTEVKPAQPQIAPPTIPIKPEKPQRKVDPDKIEQPSKDPERKASYEEEEGREGDPDKMLQDLAEILDSPLVDGKIDYNGQVVEFQSEPMCFAVNGKTMKNLKTAEQASDYLTSSAKQVAGPSAQKFAQGSNVRKPAQAQNQIPHQVTTEKKHFHSHKKRLR